MMQCCVPSLPPPSVEGRGEVGEGGLVGMTRPPDPLWGEGIGQSPTSKPDFVGLQYTPSSLRMQDAEQR